ncbi:MAG: DNA polymerase IV [Actinobacteria bacterium]|nr:MAG: DNA polymerase IV [Actinomycetota bacterium]
MAAARNDPPPEPILHVDMDAFYASVEARDDRTLAGRPLAVGGAGPRGVVMSASYEARAFGVRSAMPSVRARRLCPELIFVPPDFERYQAESERVMAIFLSFTPLVEPLSLDEAFLDVAGAARMFGSPDEIAGRIRERVRSERSLNCSVGVAPNKFLAKLASAHAKPDGVVVVRADRVRAFLDPLPVEDLWGVGEQTAAALDRLGARTVSDLLALPDGVLARAIGPGPAAHLLALGRGDDDRAVTPHEPAKQVSAEETFERDLDAPGDIHREILRLAERVATRLRASATAGRTVTLKVRFASFRTVTRSRTLDEPTDSAARLAAVAKDLFERMRLVRPRIRLLGVAASGLSAERSEQLQLGERPDRWRHADRAMDTLRRRFGDDAVDRAALADRRRITRPQRELRRPPER